MKMFEDVVVLFAVVGIVLSSSYIPGVGGPANAGKCPYGWIEVTIMNETECVYEANGSLYGSVDECVDHCETNGVISSSIWYGAGAISMMFGPWGFVPAGIFGTIGYLTSTYGPSCEEVCSPP